MPTSSFSERDIDDLILKYADEAFTLGDAVRFEVLIRHHPDLQQAAETNRSVRKRLTGLPEIPAREGFEERLQLRLAREV